MGRGIPVVISGYSGVGKNTLIELVLKSLPKSTFSVSCTTRAPRKGEIDGVNYHFITREQFDKLVEEDAFIEHTVTFTNCYGTLKSELDKPLSEGIDVLMELNVVGARNLKALHPESVTIFVTPPSMDELKQRLIGRGSETPETMSKRLAEIELESKEICNYDYVLVNDVATECAANIVDIIKTTHLRYGKEKKNLFDINSEE